MSQFMMSLTSAVNDVTTEISGIAETVAADMPLGEVVLKSSLAYLSIFLVVGLIIGTVWLLGKLTNKNEK